MAGVSWTCPWCGHKNLKLAHRCGGCKADRKFLEGYGIGSTSGTDRSASAMHSGIRWLRALLVGGSTGVLLSVVVVALLQKDREPAAAAALQSPPAPTAMTTATGFVVPLPTQTSAPPTATPIPTRKPKPTPTPAP